MEERVKTYLNNLHNYEPEQGTVLAYLVGIAKKYQEGRQPPHWIIWGEYVTRMLGPRNDEGETFTPQEQKVIDYLRKGNQKFQKVIKEQITDEELKGLMVMSPIIWGRYRRDPCWDATVAYQALEITAGAMYWASGRGMGQDVQKYYLPRFQEVVNALYVDKNFLPQLDAVLRVQNRLNQTENRDGQMYESFRNRAIRMLCGDPSCDQYIEQGKIENKQLKKVFSKAQKLVKMDEEGEEWKKGKLDE